MDLSQTCKYVQLDKLAKGHVFEAQEGFFRPFLLF